MKEQQIGMKNNYSIGMNFNKKLLQKLINIQLHLQTVKKVNLKFFIKIILEFR